IGPRQLLPELAALDWKDRQVRILFDTDGPRPKPDVVRAAEALARTLRRLGAVVRIAWLSPAAYGGKVAVDEWLTRHSPAELQTVLDEAREAVSAVPVLPLPVEQSWPSPLATEAFHGLAGEAIGVLGPASEADPAALLFQLLVGFGNV